MSLFKGLAARLAAAKAKQTATAAKAEPKSKRGQKAESPPPSSVPSPQFSGLAARLAARKAAAENAASPPSSVASPQFSGLAARLAAIKAAKLGKQQTVLAPDLEPMAAPTVHSRNGETFVPLPEVGRHLAHPELGARVQWAEEERGGRFVHHTRSEAGRVTGAPEGDHWAFVWVTADAGGAERKVPLGALRVLEKDVARFVAEAERQAPSSRTAKPATAPLPRPADRAVADVILEQLGGNAFLRMTGASNVQWTDNALHFRLPPAFAKNGINHVEIRLEPNDLYTVVFTHVGRAPKFDTKTVATVDMVDASSLTQIFRERTGLETRMPQIVRGSAPKAKPARRAQPSAPAPATMRVPVETVVSEVTGIQADVVPSKRGSGYDVVAQDTVTGEPVPTPEAEGLPLKDAIAAANDIVETGPVSPPTMRAPTSYDPRAEALQLLTKGPMPWDAVRSIAKKHGEGAVVSLRQILDEMADEGAIRKRRVGNEWWFELPTAKQPTYASAKGAGMQTIVVAWLDEEQEAIPGHYRTDLGERTKFRTVAVPKTAIWVNRGTAEDVVKAEAHAATMPGGRVFTFPESEPDPRGRAAKEIMADLLAAAKSTYREAAARAERPTSTREDHAAWLAAQAAYYRAGGSDPANGWPSAAEAPAKPARIAKEKPKTFDQVRKMLLAGLAERGWTVKSDLKIPHATMPSGDFKLWFKPQAVYISKANAQLGDARSMTTDMREYKTVDDLIHHASEFRRGYNDNVKAYAPTHNQVEKIEKEIVQETKEAKRDAASIDAELDRLRLIAPHRPVNHVTEAIREAIKAVRDLCEEPDAHNPQASTECSNAQETLREALRQRSYLRNTAQGSLFGGFKEPRDQTAADAVIERIEALSEKLETTAEKIASVRAPEIPVDLGPVDLGTKVEIEREIKAEATEAKSIDAELGRLEKVAPKTNPIADAIRDAIKQVRGMCASPDKIAECTAGREALREALDARRRARGADKELFSGPMSKRDEKAVEAVVERVEALAEKLEETAEKALSVRAPLHVAPADTHDVDEGWDASSAVPSVSGASVEVIPAAAVRDLPVGSLVWEWVTDTYRPNGGVNGSPLAVISDALLTQVAFLPERAGGSEPGGDVPRAFGRDFALVSRGSGKLLTHDVAMRKASEWQERIRSALHGAKNISQDQDRLRKRILAAIRERNVGWASLAQMAEELGYDEATFQGVLDDLEREGKIVREASKGQASVYLLAGTSVDLETKVLQATVDGARSVSELATAIGYDAASVESTLRQLESEGRVQRRTEPGREADRWINSKRVGEPIPDVRSDMQPLPAMPATAEKTPTVSRRVVDSVAAVKRLPPGTRLDIIADARGPRAPSGRVVVQARANDMVMRVVDPTSKLDGEESYLPLKGARVEPTVAGFRVLFDEGAMTEYVFSAPMAGEAAAPMQLPPMKQGAGGMAEIKLTNGTKKKVKVLGRDEDLFVHKHLDKDEDRLALTHEASGAALGGPYESVDHALAYAMDLNSPEIRPLFDRLAKGDTSIAGDIGRLMKEREGDRLQRHLARGAKPVVDQAIDLAKDFAEGSNEDLRQKAARRDANIQAVQTASHILRTFSKPNDEQLRIMGAYSGWGGLGSGAGQEAILDKIKPDWPDGFPFPEARGLGYEYYTPTKVCAEVARVLKPLLPALAAAGGGTIEALEPSAGIGRFVRAVEGPGFESVLWHAVEYSKVSAALLRAMRPDLDLFEGPFEKWVSENETQYRGRLRLVVSNPPYGEVKVRGAARVEDTDPVYRAYKNADDYFLRRGLDLLAKDGIGVYLIPTGFLSGTSKNDVELRRDVLLRHHLMCAYRLPSKVFPGALVTTDLIFFRSRGGRLESIDAADEAILHGDYFRDFPTHVLGTYKEVGGRYGKKGEKNEKSYEIVGEFKGLPEFRERDICTSCVHAPIVEAPPPKNLDKSLGKALLAAHQRLAQASSLGLRLAKFLTLVAAQDTEMPSLSWEELHRSLLDWSRAYGPPSADAELVEAARKGDDAGLQKFLTGFQKGSAELVPFLTTRPVWTPRYAGRPGDVLAEAEFLYRQHRKLLKSDVKGSLHLLYAAGWAEDEPGELVPSEIYDFGDLWPKYDRAKARGDAGDTQAVTQAAHLLEIIKPAMFDDIGGISPQQAWIPLELTQGWISSVSKSGGVELELREGLIQIAGKGYEKLEGGWSNDVENILGWINHDRTLFRPQRRSLVDGKDKENIDDARLRQAHEWEQAFRAYCAADENRRQHIERVYQRTFQGYRQPKYSVEPLTLARWGEGVNLRPHQNAGARRQLANRGGILAFDVGVGKTYTGCAILAGARQEGWSKRPVILVPNSIIWNWVAELKKALPDYRVGLIGSKRKVISSGPRKGYITSETDTPEERAEKWAAFQAGQYDVMLCTYSSFTRTKLGEQQVIEYAEATTSIQRQLEMRKRNIKKKVANAEGKEEKAAEKGKATEKVDRGLSEREEALLGEGTAAWIAEKLELPKSWKYDPGISWDEIGVDLLIVDEAQNFKNLYLPETREHGVPKFMGSGGEGSNRSWQLDFRAMTVRKRTGGAGVVLLSATPAKNSPLEFYNLIQYVDHDAFVRTGIGNPEQFIDRYCKIEPRDIVTADGDVETASACIGFQNLHELRDIVFRYGEFVTGEDVEGFGAKARHTTWLELVDKHGATPEEIARVWGWGLADVKLGLSVARGKVPENPDGGAEATLEAEKPRAKTPARRAALASKRLPNGKTWLDILTSTCVKLDVPLVIGLDDGLKLPVPLVARVEIEENSRQKIKRLAYKQKLEDALENPHAEPGAMLGILASMSLIAIHPALDERHESTKTGPDGKKRFVMVPDWNWDTAGDISDPSSPKFDALATNIGKNPSCGHIVFVENIAAHIWIRMTLAAAGVPIERIAILNGDSRNPKGKSQDRQQIAQEFNGTPAVVDENGKVIEPEIPPLYDVVIANQVAYEGINLQTRTCAIHHIDLPWDPATLQQRNGRAWRQGNKFLGIKIYYYEMRCYPDGMKHKLIEGKAGWMADLIVGQKRDTNNPSAQMDVGPEEALGMIACDAAAVKQRFDEIRAKRAEEAKVKLAESASQTLRGAASRYQRAISIAKKNPTEANRLRAEADQRLDDLTHLDPEAWPWISWAMEAKKGVALLVPPAGGSPVYETLRLAIPDQWDPKVKNHIEFGKTHEGKEIFVRVAGQAEWRKKTMQEIVDLKLKPEYRTAEWPQDDEDKIDKGDGTSWGYTGLAERLRRIMEYGSAATGVSALWEHLSWKDAPDAFVARMWHRYGERFTQAFQKAVGLSYYADSMHTPVIRRGGLEVGLKRAFDELIPPTQAGWEQFLEFAANSDARSDTLGQAAVFWWGRSLPRDLFSSGTPEQQAMRAMLQKARIQREKEEAAETERVERERREQEERDRREQQARFQREAEERMAAQRARESAERAERDEREAAALAQNPHAGVNIVSPRTRDANVRDRLKAIGCYLNGKNRDGEWQWFIPLRVASQARAILGME